MGLILKKASVADVLLMARAVELHREKENISLDELDKLDDSKIQATYDMFISLLEDEIGNKENIM